MNPLQPEPSILIVDDNEDNRYTLSMMLELAGYRSIASAEDGEDALRHIECCSPDLVLLDIMMPKLSGFEVLERLRAQRRLEDLPVIVLSALNELSGIARCIELGAEDYLPKPFDPVLLKARITACVEKKRLRDEVRRHLARTQQELNAARDLQLAMLPDFPARDAQSDGIGIFGQMRPAREVGGDIYDYVLAPDGRLIAMIGDASDKGAAAAFFAASLKHLARTIIRLRPEAHPAELMSLLNATMCDGNSSMMFATFLVVSLDARRGEVTICSAAHPEPILLSDQGIARPLDLPRGRPLGLRAESDYPSETLQLPRGTSLFLYTDGLSEACNESGVLYGTDRIASCLAGLGAAKPHDLVAAVIAEVDRFAGEAPQSDDMAALAIALEPLPGHQQSSTEPDFEGR